MASGVQSESEPCAKAFIALARIRSSGWPVISTGSAIRSSGRIRPGASAPSGSRWIDVIGAPESVVGIAQTRPPRTAPIAFAASMTRPPPSATRFGEATRSSSSAEIAGTAPAGTSWTAAAPSASAPGAASSARLGAEQLVPLPPPVGEGPGGTGEAALPEEDDALPVAPLEFVLVEGKLAGHESDSALKGTS